MSSLGTLGFTSPWLLVALISLPILWYILRAVPPSPIRQRFPGVILLLGLKDKEAVSDQTPWWLLLLRILAIGAIIIGLAGPVLNPNSNTSNNKSPLLVVLDGSWGGADQWQSQIKAVEAELKRAGSASREVAIFQLTLPEPPIFQAANTLIKSLAKLYPTPWQPDSLATAVVKLPAGDFETVWFSDGLYYNSKLPMLNALETHGPVRVVETNAEVLALTPAVYNDGAIEITAMRSLSGQERAINILVQGRDPIGNAVTLGIEQAIFASGDTVAQASLTLPAEMRARITRFEIQAVRSAGAVTLVSDSLRRREIALISNRDGREGLELLSPLHYLERALAPTVDLLHGSISDVIPANPDIIVLADVAKLVEEEANAISKWIQNGGLLLRFAGPKIAASSISRETEDPLMPVRLRSGGRSVGGAMSWGAPKTLAPFKKDSPFFGLPLSGDVDVTVQVMAQPDPTLAERVIAELSDGTPLVTRKHSGRGQIVFFHVTANAEWSSLPLSGLFVEMLDRLSSSTTSLDFPTTSLEGTIWTPQIVMDGFGRLKDATSMSGVPGSELTTLPASPSLLPGVYTSGNNSFSRNVLTVNSEIKPSSWPSHIPISILAFTTEQPLSGYLLAASIALLCLDVISSLALSGRLTGNLRATQAVVAGTMFLLTISTSQANAQQGNTKIATAASEVVLAHVITNNQKVDEIAQAGLRGLSNALFFRTSVEPSDPVGVNLETDELAFFPLLYWPISPDQPRPSQEAYTKLNDYLKSGGLILFDTRDADVSSFTKNSANGRKLRDLAKALNIPALEPVPQDHILTRTFYLLQDFPGRHSGRELWVEAALPDSKQVEGMPFRKLNDGVTPIVIGGNDWASAWAITKTGQPMLPVGVGFGGERQRELAYRFGINLVMHVLTGNYKSDQVHVPALLDRLGQ